MTSGPHMLWDQALRQGRERADLWELLASDEAKRLARNLSRLARLGVSAADVAAGWSKLWK